jgi:hypothetical protein
MATIHTVPNSKLTIAEAMLKSGVVTINEIREYLGLTPVPHGNELPILRNI